MFVKFNKPLISESIFNSIRSAFIIVIYLIIIPKTVAQAQEQYPWSPPFQISNEGIQVSSNQIVSDRYGYAHLFWIESGFPDNQFIIQYARFDGDSWTSPVDIYQGRTSPGELSPFVDDDNILHLVWSEELGGVAYHMSALSSSAVNLRSWGESIRIDIPAQEIKFRVDSKGDYHILYTSYKEDEEGVYAVYSKDKGISWSLPTRIDIDKPKNYLPKSLQFEVDSSDRLHVVWYYMSNLDSTGDLVSYSSSLNGGQDWSEPFIIDKVYEGGRSNLAFAGPIMAVSGDNVHIVWAGGELSYRNHRISRDGGDTWSMPIRIFGDLNGQARDGFAVDGAGNIHFLGQIRYPQGIYHAYWDEERDQWLGLSMVYLIAQDHLDPIGDRIHAHFLRPVFLLGNQLIITYQPITYDSVYIMIRKLDNISPLSALQTPEPTLIHETPIQNQYIASPTLQVEDDLKNIYTIPIPVSSERVSYYWGVVPAMLFILSSVIYISVIKTKKQ